MKFGSQTFEMDDSTVAFKVGRLMLVGISGELQRGGVDVPFESEFDRSNVG